MGSQSGLRLPPGSGPFSAWRNAPGSASNRHYPCLSQSHVPGFDWLQRFSKPVSANNSWTVGMREIAGCSSQLVLNLPYRRCSACKNFPLPMLLVRSSVDMAICRRPLPRRTYGDWMAPAKTWQPRKGGLSLVSPADPAWPPASHLLGCRCLHQAVSLSNGAPHLIRRPNSL
jgi:hypothetical protein